MQTLRERRNRDGKGLFRSSSERGHGDGDVMRSSFAARNIIFCKERCLIVENSPFGTTKMTLKSE